MWGYVSHPNFSTKFLRTYFFKNSPGIFRVFSLPLKIPDKNKPWPLETPQIVLHSSEILRPKNQDPWNHFTWFFLDHAWKYHGLVLMFLVNVNIKILFFNVYINRETSAPDQKNFPPSDPREYMRWEISSQLILGSSRKKNQGLVKNNVEFESIFKHAVV